MHRRAGNMEKLSREFTDIKTGSKLQDPNPDMSPEEVVKFYSNTYPHLVNASIEGPDLSSGKAKYKFSVIAGTKG